MSIQKTIDNLTQLLKEIEQLSPRDSNGGLPIVYRKFYQQTATDLLKARQWLTDSLPAVTEKPPEVAEEPQDAPEPPEETIPPVIDPLPNPDEASCSISPDSAPEKPKATGNKAKKETPLKKCPECNVKLVYAGTDGDGVTTNTCPKCHRLYTT